MPMSLQHRGDAECDNPAWRAPYDPPVLYVVVFAVSVCLAGLVMLVLLTKRAFGQVKALGHTVAEASARIADASAELETIAPRERS